MTPKATTRITGLISFFAGALIASLVGMMMRQHPAATEKTDTPEEIAAADAQALEQAMEDLSFREPFSMAALGSRRIQEMAPDNIPVGSWWTDGDVYFKVLSNTPDTLYMVGTNLEDHGMEIIFVKHADSTMVTDGASVFAFHNSPVLYNRLRLADGMDVDMLVAFYDRDCTCPQAVLLRYHGAGLEKQNVLP